MNIPSDIKHKLESFLGEIIRITTPVSGGCIAQSKMIETPTRKRYFLKMLTGNPTVFFKEAHGLLELAKARSIRVPKVLLADSEFLLLEYIEPGLKPSDFFSSFGKALAQMHAFTVSDYGFFEDNFIGASPQYNVAQADEKTSWSEFYFQKRLLPQLRMAEQNGYATQELRKAIAKLEHRITDILKGSEERPVLLHGDLWSGNYLCDSEGKPVLIDPAVYYGHREADLAMTKMFGGFSLDFYSAYYATYPLHEGWEYRENLYLLYHYLNHLNLFGAGYYGTTMNLLSTYI
jgi:fructosamine-3-kinase